MRKRTLLLVLLVLIIIITVLVAKAKDIILRRMIQGTKMLSKISGLILIIVGSYLVVISFFPSGF